MSAINHFRDLRVYAAAMDLALEIHELTKSFPVEEKYSLVDQIRRASRSVCANLAEAWRKRRYKAAFIAKLSDSESETAETQVWLEFANKTGLVSDDIFGDLDRRYENVIGQLIRMIDTSEKWVIPQRKNNV